MTGAGARVFAALLYAFPRRFRHAYGPDMAAAFDDRRRAARRNGALAVAALWLRTAVNLTVAGIAERNGVDFRFTTYTKHAFGLMLISVAISHVYLWLRYL